MILYKWIYKINVNEYGKNDHYECSGSTNPEDVHIGTKVSPGWLPSYIKATQLVLKIYQNGWIISSRLTVHSIIIFLNHFLRELSDIKNRIAFLVGFSNILFFLSRNGLFSKQSIQNFLLCLFIKSWKKKNCLFHDIKMLQILWFKTKCLKYSGTVERMVMFKQPWS